MNLDKREIEALPQRHRAALINSLPGYKPVVLVGTADTKGHTNLSAINSCFHIGAAPPLLGMIIRPAPEGTERHTLENILDTRWYTFNALTTEMTQRGHHTSARFPREQSEFEACGFEPSWQMPIKAPFVADSPLQIGLKLIEHQPLAINGTQLIIGGVESVQFSDDALREDGSLDLHTMGLVAAVGLDAYHEAAPGQRYAYAKPDRPPEPL
jgi:flavin reductase (DIM6/NTAB) family NADH-FMN oxidoreductase RutF